MVPAVAGNLYKSFFQEPPLKAGADWPILAPFLKISFPSLIGNIQLATSGPARYEGAKHSTEWVKRDSDLSCCLVLIHLQLLLCLTVFSAPQRTFPSGLLGTCGYFEVLLDTLRVHLLTSLILFF